MSTITPIRSSEEALKGITAGNGISTTLDEVTVGVGHQKVKLALDRYDGRDENGDAEPPEFGIAFEQAYDQLDWAEIPPESIDAAIAALLRLKRAWNPEGARVPSIPAFEVGVNGGCYFGDAPMVPVEPHEDSPSIGLQVQSYRCGDEIGIERYVGVAPMWPSGDRQWPYYMTLSDALQLAEDIRDTALALIADSEVAA